jgi:hypothetical protein
MNVPLPTNHLDTIPSPKEAKAKAMPLPIVSQSEPSIPYSKTPLNNRQRFTAVSNLGMQCWKSLLNVAPPRPGAKMNTQRNSMRPLVSSSLYPQSEVRDLELRCICPFDHKDGVLIHCYVCAKSQHALCYYVDGLPFEGEWNSASHQCLHCEEVRGDLQEPRIADAATVRRAGHALRTWCGDIAELGEGGEIGDREAWENAGMLLGMLVRLIAESPYAVERCGEATAVRMRFHSEATMECMLDIPRRKDLRSTGDGEASEDVDDSVVVCPEEEFGKTTMSLVQGLVELLPGLLGPLDDMQKK